MYKKCSFNGEGFTLIELSIVLVVIGSITGGVLVGQDLISAASIRAQISQFEKYNTAVNTFRGKYGYLPGDMPDPVAGQFGFTARGILPGQGDGNGIIEGNDGNLSYTNYGDHEMQGETIVFWRDLSDSHLIEDSFTNALATGLPPIDPVTINSTPSIKSYFPVAKIGNGNFINVFSGGPIHEGDGLNYYSLSIITAISPTLPVSSAPGITVNAAYSIDKKIDDGLPQTGNVLAFYNSQNQVNWLGAWPGWPGQGSSTSCYENGNLWGAVEAYSLSENNGNGVNCALSFRFQ